MRATDATSAIAPGVQMGEQSGNPPDTTVGRPARVVSIAFPAGRPLDEIADVVDRQGAKGADLVVLPETWRGQAGPPETLEGPTIAAMAALAHRHRTYIVCPIDRADGTRRRNTAVLLDRAGRVAWLYDKVYPYWSEFDLEPPVEPGEGRPAVYQADFGRLGFAICFDVNFPRIWNGLAEAGAELVVWPSAYSAGTALQAHALNHHYYIVSCTQSSDCQVYDLTGERIVDHRGSGVVVTRVTLDLDRGIYHQNFNTEPRGRLLRDHPGDIVVEQDLEREQWFVLRAARSGVSARGLARRYGLEELRDYVARSRSSIDGIREKEQR